MTLFPPGDRGDAPPERFARVVLERSFDRYPEGLTYAVPASLEVSPGMRVLCPLARQLRPVEGWVVAVGDARLLDDLDVSRIREIEGIDPLACHLPASLAALGNWISSYYCCPIGVTLASMVPAAVRKGIGTKQVRHVSLGVAATDTPRGLSTKQRAVLRVLEQRGTEAPPMAVESLRIEAALATAAPIDSLIRRGVLQVSHHTTVQAAWREHALPGASEEIRLSERQRQVVDAISRTLDAGFSSQLIHGVTGSGKTEVYLRLIRQVLSVGKSALVLVPEIALTPQTTGRLLARLPGETVAILHSGLTAAQRHEQWRLAADSGPKLVIGARSAVFAPIPDGELGLIIVDEEHDSSYKQDQAPRYHGRDTAIRRAQLAHCPIVLGSATPSLESWNNATRRGAATLHELPDRAPGLVTPTIRIVDFREEQRQWPDRRVHLVGPTLHRELARALDAGEQAILLLNRRGYANWVACSASAGCDWRATCDRCDAPLIVHRIKEGADVTARFIRCHHCLQEQRLPTACPECKSKVLVFGLGTQRVEDELLQLFPALREPSSLLRVDSDSMTSATDFHATLGAFAEGRCRVLVGTQMIAKGLDFPGVSVVGVISADTALHMPDFRASERTFQLVSQVCGRSGRSARGGVAVIQTFAPAEPAIVLAASQDYRAFAEAELHHRETFRLPPVWRMARIVVRHASEVEGSRIADEVAERLRGLPECSAARVIGGTPCPLARVSEMFRHQVEIHSPTAAALSDILAAARNRGWLRLGEAMAVDVDPVSLL